MEYTMKLIFSKKADMVAIYNEIEDICQKTGNKILEKKDSYIAYGADSYDSFAPAYVQLRYSVLVKKFLLDAIWIDEEGEESCRKTILEAVS